MRKISHIILFLMACSIAKANSFSDKCVPPTARVFIDINNVRARITNAGNMFWDIYNSDDKYEIPRGSRISAVSTTALWMSGYDINGELYTAAQTWRSEGTEYYPGPLNDDGTIDSLTCIDWNKIFTVYGKEIIDVKTNNNISYDILRWPGEYAPFFDKNADGIYDPSLGDYPVLNLNDNSNIPGQMIFSIFNDNGGPHLTHYNENTFGVEVRAIAYAYSSGLSDVINNTTLYKYKIINKSNRTYNDYRVGVYMVSELGYSDNYIGCDLNRELFYTYNGDNFDEDDGIDYLGYGQSPPAVGVLILNSDKNDDGNKLGMGAFILRKYCEFGCIGDQTYASNVECLMRGLWLDGSPITYGTTGGVGNGVNTTKFLFPGTTDPNGRPNWIEKGTAGGRQKVISTNSKTLDPGEVTEFEFAVVWARDTPGTNLTSLEKLKLSSDTLRAAYETNFSSFSTGINYNKHKISVYPNPANDFISIKGLLEKTEIIIYNLQGKVIKTQTIFVGEKIDVSDLAKGVYFIKAENFTTKFLKH